MKKLVFVILPTLLLIVFSVVYLHAKERAFMVKLRESERQNAPVEAEVDLYNRSYALVIGIDNYTCYDMLGNVWEWCQDWYGSYPSSSVTDPEAEHYRSARVYGGGRWGSGPWAVRCANRDGVAPGRRYDFIGFRLARNP